MNDNGQKLPSLTIGWDADTQQVDLGFDPKEFKTWEFVLAVLAMAKDKAETFQKMQRLQSMQMQAVEAQRVQQQLRQSARM